MTALHYSDPNPLEHLAGTERRTAAPPGKHRKRRINDSAFNKARWLIVIGLWFLGGIIVLAYLVKALMQ